MDSVYVPSKNSRILSENRVSKINKLYEDVQKQRSKQQSNHTYGDSVVSNNSTSVVGLESPTLEEMNGPGPVVNRRNSISNSDFTIKPQSIFTGKQTRPSPASSYGYNGDSPDISYGESNFEREQEEDDQNLMPRLRSKGSIIRMSAENTPYKPVRQFMVGSQAVRVRAQRSALRQSPRKRNTRTQLRSQLGKPVPLDYMPSSGAQYQRSAEDDSASLELRLKRIMEKDRSVFENKLRNIRRHYDEDPSETQAPVMYNKVTANKHGTSTDNNVYDNAQVNDGDHIRAELSKQTQKLDEILMLLRSSSNGTHMELLSWVTCIIILLFCNIYVYYYL
ncbi:HBR523Cp [Eremothecium sinecaudum]|uniref:HBR523Cp n=1 Tax=Eremothecium sinecaudum TaxID=45286 RepID=A0A120K1I3_9SACH|nr:HBR523Cp [Eremothecium sinecaudum]AMD19424.1 HBR523Cp [Eremothecium sinecaudum]